MSLPIRSLVLAALSLAFSTPVFAIGTAFTYQGTLEDGGGLASGEYDLQFQLLDDGDGSIGAPVIVQDVDVVRGVFTVELDFGGAAFDGDERKLRISVRPGASSGAFTPLDPPTALHPTPYAQVAEAATIAASIANDTVDSSKIINGSVGSADIDTTQVQARVAGTCLAGSSIRIIDATGAVTCQPDGGGAALTIPFSSTQPSAGALFGLTNSGDGPGLLGVNSTTTSSVAAVRGLISSASPGGFSSGVRGENAGTGGLGIGVYGSQAGSGWGVYGTTPNGLGVYGNSSAAGYGVYANSNTGTGLQATSNSGVAANISIFNSANNSNVVDVSTVGSGIGVNVTGSGSGKGVFASTGLGFAVHGVTSAQSSAGIIGDNNGGGEAVVGRANSNIAGAVVGRNDGGGYGVRGFVTTNTSGTAVGVLGQVGLNNGQGSAGRFENLNATNTLGNTLHVQSNSNGNIPDNTQGNVASFINTNSNSVSAAVRGEVKTIFGNFGAAAIFGTSSGTGGFAGLFHASNVNGNGAALVALADGNGNAITANAEKGGNGVETNINGTGNALYAWVPTFATGRAGRFNNFNTGNTSDTITVTTVGNGIGVNAKVDRVTGTSPALKGEVNSQFANFGTAGVYGISSGTGGYAGLFHASHPSGNGPALIAIADGNGNGVTANASNSGDGVETTVDGTGNALYAWTPNFSNGKAARLVNYNTANTNPVLTVEQHSSGAIALFKSGNPGTVNVARINAAGRGFFNGGTVMGGADLAEVVPISGHEPAPGDVVEIDPERPSHFRLAATPHSALVAGVISTEPGIVLNAKNADESLPPEGPALALAGRVPVKVTNENGAIAPGDLLVASATPGHAMRASLHPAPGTVIGKALEGFAQDADGVIEMLVMLR